MSTKLPSFAELNPAAWIKLADGRPILMQRLVQSQTYGGLLVGLPGERVDKDKVERIADAARAEFGVAPEPYVIKPAKIPFTARRRRGRRQIADR